MSRNGSTSKLRAPIPIKRALLKKRGGQRKPMRRTRFRSKVVTASRKRPPLRPGAGNRKMGAVLKVGRWKGCHLYSVGHEEGRTCPASCPWRSDGRCNAANSRGYRHRANRQFYQATERQIRELLAQHAEGIAVRLFVTGDFPDAKAVRFWASMLKKNPRLRIWGHTHHQDDMLELIHRKLNLAFPNRCLIRCSDSYTLPHRAIAVHPIGRIGQYEGVVCPATLTRAPGGPLVKRKGDKPLATCSTCGACMNPKVSTILWPVVQNGVGYLDRGKGSVHDDAEQARLPQPGLEAPGTTAA